MKKYLYTLLALLMVNLHAEELSSIPTGPLSDEFGVPLNSDGEKVARALLRKPSLNMDSYFPYVGFGLLGLEGGVAYRNFDYKIELDVRVNNYILVSVGKISFSKLVMFGSKQKKEPRKYLGIGSGVGLGAFFAGNGYKYMGLFFPRIFYGVETSYGFCDFGVDLMTSSLDWPLPIPDLRWGFRF
jgi:hypothetical protein